MSPAPKTEQPPPPPPPEKLHAGCEGRSAGDGGEKNRLAPESQSARERRSQTRTQPLLLPYANTLPLRGCAVTEVMISVSASMSAGLVSTTL